MTHLTGQIGFPSKSGYWTGYRPIVRCSLTLAEAVVMTSRGSSNDSLLKLGSSYLKICLR